MSGCTEPKNELYLAMPDGKALDDIAGTFLLCKDKLTCQLTNYPNNKSECKQPQVDRSAHIWGVQH